MKRPLTFVLAAPFDAVLAAPAHVYLSAVERVRVNRARRLPEYPRAEVTFDDFLTRHDLEMEALPTVPGEVFAHCLVSRPVWSGLMQVRFAYQRVVRGWDDRSLWSLDTHLARTLAEQLDALAEEAHGWPQGDEFPTFEDWQKALRENAARLHAYQACLFDPTGDEYDIADVMSEGQAALRWVADHLPSLWD